MSFETKDNSHKKLSVPSVAGRELIDISLGYVELPGTHARVWSMN